MLLPVFVPRFFEHFLFISDAMTFEGAKEESQSLWNDEDGFYYDAISWGPGHSQQIPIHSLVGLIPLYATLTLEPDTIKRFPGFKKRMDWFLKNRPEMSTRNIANMSVAGKSDRRLLALASKERLVRILEKMLDEKEFLSEFGIRSLSKYHQENPWEMDVNGEKFGVGYWPGDSRSGMFGGNSNWRGPIWLAVNFLLVESLQRFHQYYGEDCLVECPTGSGDVSPLAHHFLFSAFALPRLTCFSPSLASLTVHEPRRRRRGDPAPNDPHLCQGRGGQPSLQRRQRDAQPRPKLLVLPPVPRVLRRKLRARTRSVPPDRMDRIDRVQHHAGRNLVQAAKDAEDAEVDGEALL